MAVAHDLGDLGVLGLARGGARGSVRTVAPRLVEVRRRRARRPARGARTPPRWGAPRPRRRRSRRASSASRSRQPALPLAAADQRERAGDFGAGLIGGGAYWRPDAGPPAPAVSYRAVTCALPVRGTGEARDERQADRSRRFRDHGLGSRRGRRRRPASRWCCGAARRRGADAMLAGLEKSLATQVERGKLEDADRDRGARPGRARSPTSTSSPSATS